MAKHLSPTLTVLHGPFRTMRYPSAEAAGSALVPKILGSYERELHPVIEELMRAGLTDVVDVGCAEGYYAVGFAIRIPTVNVHAFDTDDRARQLCARLAAANGVGDRVSILGLCDETTLAGLHLGERPLLISDCEGYEARLFSPAVVMRLASCRLLIEVHDRHDPELGSRLRSSFSRTHECKVIDSIDDTRKLRSYRYEELAPFDAATRRDLLSEGRGMVMEWLYLTPRSSSVPPAP